MTKRAWVLGVAMGMGCGHPARTSPIVTAASDASVPVAIDAATPVTFAATPCGDAPNPVAKAGPASSSVGPAQLFALDDGRLMFAATAYGGWDAGWITSMWGFLLTGDQLSTIGELAHAAEASVDTAFLAGHGTPVYLDSAGALQQCTAGGHRALPALPAGVTQLGSTVDGTRLVVATETSGASAGCKAMASEAVGSSHLAIYSLGLTDATPTWQLDASHDVAATHGKGCRAVFIPHTALDHRDAGFEARSCTPVDGGDYGYLDECATTIVAYSHGAWTEASYGAISDRADVIVDVDAGRVQAAIPMIDENQKTTTTIYRVDGTTLVTVGTPMPVDLAAFHGTHFVTWTPGGSVQGYIGFGFQLTAYDLVDTAWKPVTNVVDVDNARGAYTWTAQGRLVAVLPEAERDRNPATVRILDVKDGKWRDVGRVQMPLSP